MQLTESGHAIVRAAAAKAFPAAEVLSFDSFGAAESTRRASGIELLVLGPEAAAILPASVDEIGRPRWAVVSLAGASRNGADSPSLEDCTAAELARHFQAVAREHELRLENLRLKGDLKTVARRIRHDLLTPVGCVSTSTHVLELVPPTDHEATAAMFSNIKSSTREILQLVDRVAFVLHASAGTEPAGPVDMSVVVRSVLEQLDPEIQKAGATVRAASSWPTVYGVPLWLQTIWYNLVENALRHGGASPEIHLEWSTVPGGHRFAVSDRGPGIAADRRTLLFRPFEQLHERPAPGLGLPIVQRLAALQGGTCHYERTADGLSRFSFTLPLDPAKDVRNGSSSA